MWRRRIVLSVMMLFFFACIFVKPAYAMDKTVLNEEKTVMPANEKVDNIIVVGHDIDIKGKVDISVIVINGNLKISKTAKINGTVMVINGNVNQVEGSYVKENILAFKFKNDTVNHLLLGFGLLLSDWLIRFVLSVGLMVVSILVSILMKNRGEKSLQLFKQQTGKLILVGAAASFALIGVILLLIISVVGIPVAILLVLPPLIAFIIGVTILGQFFGAKLISRYHPSNWITVFAGSFLLISAFNFPIFGFILMLGIFWLSTGLMILWIVEKLFKRKAKDLP
jgi:hypothetical protein